MLDGTTDIVKLLSSKVSRVALPLRLLYFLLLNLWPRLGLRRLAKT